MALLDTLKLAQNLRDKAGFTQEHAEAVAVALQESLVVEAQVATRRDIDEAVLRLTIRIGIMIVVATGLLIATIFLGTFFWLRF